MRDVAKQQLLRDLLPSLARELRDLLLKQGESDLAGQVWGLRIVDRCRCGDDFCATFYVQPKPEGAYGPTHRNISLEPIEGMLILDVIDDKIACVEVLYRDEVRQTIEDALP
jgi:hypothetical protein